MAGIGSLLKGATKGAKAIQEAAEASRLAPPRLNWSADNLDAIGAIPNVYDFINNPGYQLREKDRQIEIVMMSPDEYINEAARILSSGSSESTAADVIQQRARNLPRIQGIQDLLDQGEDFQIPFLDYKGGGQEGLHRAMAAKNLGEESIPVMIMRSARGEDRVPLPKKAQDMAVGGAVSSAAKAIRRLVEAGFPESTAEKIVMGDLPMDPAAKAARMSDLGFSDRPYYFGAPDVRGIRNQGGFSGRTMQAYNRDAGEFEEVLKATYLSPDRSLASTYADPRRAWDYQGAEPEVMALRMSEGNLLEVNAGGKKFNEVPLNKVRDQIPEGKRGEFDAIVSTYADPTLSEQGKIRTGDLEIAANKLGYDGFRIKNVIDTYSGKGRPSEIVAVFDPARIRSPEAAFDPDQVDSPNLMAGLAPYAVPTVLGGSLLGAAMAPEEAEAAGFGTLARAIGRPTRAAYTGSAAKYARPSLQSVGTGEGNQAFGYGLYFSDSPEIAGGYRRGVAGQKVLDRMSDRYLMDDLDLQSVDEMLDLGEFAAEDEKLMRALQDADYLGFDRPMDAVRAAFGPDLNAFDASDPAVQKLKGIADEVGFLYEVEVPADDFIDWNLTLEEQPEVVQQVVRQNAQDPRIRDKIDAGSFRGSDAYYLFGNNPEVNSMMWAQYGVPGVRYNSFGRAVRGLDDARARKDAPQNYVIFDENLINIVRRNDEALENNFDERAAQAAALDVRKPLAAILAAGAAGTTQAEDLAPGEYDAIASQRLGRELDRLMQLAEIRRQPSIVPLQDTAMARVGDYLLEDRPSEMDTLQRALQRLDMGQGLGDYLQTTGQGDPTTVMQNLMAGLDIFDVLGLLPGAGKASSAAVRAAQRGN